MKLRVPKQLRPGLLLTYLVTVITTSTMLIAPLDSLAATKPVTATLPGPFATILFSRTEMTEADNCVADDTNIARLDNVVAPYLKSLGLTATGTLATANVSQSTEKCTHYNDSMMASWDDATNLSQNDGWTFVSHTATYPSNVTNLSPAQSDAETCGSANTITAHGLSGANGYIAYPGTSGDPTNLQTNYGSKCFAWARVYGSNGITASTAATTAPYWQNTHAGDGGPCGDKTQACSKIKMQNGSTKYTQPSELIGDINGMTAGKWFTFQSFVLVEGKSPTYTSGGEAWDCTSSNPAEHWTNDNERYCYNDFQSIVQAMVAKGVRVTDPLSVGVAFGRPATYPTSSLSSSDTTPPTSPTLFQATADTADTNVALTWAAATDNVAVTGYDLERSTDESTWTVLNNNIAGTSFTDSTAAAGTQYFYRLKASDAAGNASGYASASATTWSPPPDTIAPSAPGSFQAIADTTDSGVALSWAASTDNVGVTGYELDRSADQANWSVLATANATSYQDNATSYSTHYYYQVKALDAAGNASDYATADVITADAPPPDTTPPSVPGSFQATAGTANPTVLLSWSVATDNVGVTGYELDRSTDQTNWSVLTANQPSTSYSDSSTSASTQYYYRVRAFDAAGNASDYGLASVTTPAPVSKITQYITNPSMESNSAAGWSTYNTTSSVTAALVAGGSKDGSYALKVTNTAKSAGVAGLMDKAPHWVSSTVVGKTYTGSVWLSGPSGTTLTAQLRECNTAGTSCPGLGSVTVKLPASGWVQATVPYTAKANGNALRFSVYGTMPGSGSFLADLFSLTSPN